MFMAYAPISPLVSFWLHIAFTFSKHATRMFMAYAPISPLVSFSQHSINNLSLLTTTEMSKSSLQCWHKNCNMTGQRIQV